MLSFESTLSCKLDEERLVFSTPRDLTPDRALCKGEYNSFLTSCNFEGEILSFLFVSNSVSIFSVSQALVSGLVLSVLSVVASNTMLDSSALSKIVFVPFPSSSTPAFSIFFALNSATISSICNPSSISESDETTESRFGAIFKTADSSLVLSSES